ncbi:MAG TPA: BglII/BstYI family type II restriction endonuclease [Chthonomonadales bacterium]|nr:BglII/BstYI family type II restriction endonuclease [Chthonomonadales bacterium]
MRVAQFHSHLDGYEFLLVHRPSLWDEITNVVGLVDAAQCRTKASKEKRTQGKVLYSPTQMNAAFRELLRHRGWDEQRVSYWVTGDERLIRKTLTMPEREQDRAIEDAHQTPNRSYNQTDFLKERVAVEVQFGKYAFEAYDLVVKHLAFYVGDVIDVGVEILPTKLLQSQMSSGVAHYEGEVYNVLRQGRGVPAVPLVLIGIEP